MVVKAGTSVYGARMRMVGYTRVSTASRRQRACPGCSSCRIRAWAEAIGAEV